MWLESTSTKARLAWIFFAASASETMNMAVSMVTRTAVGKPNYVRKNLGRSGQCTPHKS